MIDGEIHERVGKALVEPQIVPPCHRHYVAEPLRHIATTGARPSLSLTGHRLRDLDLSVTIGN